MEVLTIDRKLIFSSGGKTFVRGHNKSGGEVASGKVVILDTTNSTATDIAFTTTTSQDDVKVLGVLQQTVANNGYGDVQIKGLCNNLKVNGTTDIAKGDELSCFTTAGIAAKATAGKGGNFATALEAYTTNDSLGVIDCWLHEPARIDSSAATYGLVGVMAAAGTAASNTVGVEASASRTDHVHALGTHVHDGATTGGATLGDHTASYIILANTTVPANTNCYIARDNTGDTTVHAITGKSVLLAVAGTDVVTVSGASVTIAQALTVSTGGAAITGNSTVTGDLTVTGSLTFGGNWTVGATLTVDELILDTDGSAPAGTNCYAVRDNAGDLTVNTITGKQFIVAVNNTDEYTFSATVFDCLDNAIDNAGYLILNAASAPAGTEVYLVNDNTGDLTLNALAAKDVIIAIAGTDEVKFDDSAHVFNDASNDRDFRVETNGLAYAIYSDGGKDSVVLGSNTDTSSADRVVTITRAARSNTAATNFYDLDISPAGAVTTTGVTAIVSTVYLAEPNITIGANSVTVASTLYIASQPTEGGANAGIVLADAVDFAVGNSVDCRLRWSTADADNHALALGLGASLAFHICQDADIATDWNVAAASNPTLYIHGAATPATEYIAISDDETDAHLNAVGANWKFEIGGTAELTLAANALNLVDSLLYGSSAAHSADTADGSLYLRSTSHATKGFVCIANAELGLIIGSDGSVDRVGTVGTNAIHIFNGTAPAGALANGGSLYCEAGEPKAMDAAGNVAVLVP